MLYHYNDGVKKKYEWFSSKALTQTKQKKRKDVRTTYESVLKNIIHTQLTLFWFYFIWLFVTLFTPFYSMWNNVRDYIRCTISIKSRHRVSRLQFLVIVPLVSMIFQLRRRNMCKTICDGADKHYGVIYTRVGTYDYVRKQYYTVLIHAEPYPTCSIVGLISSYR